MGRVTSSSAGQTVPGFSPNSWGLLAVQFLGWQWHHSVSTSAMCVPSSCHVLGLWVDVDFVETLFNPPQTLGHLSTLRQVFPSTNYLMYVPEKRGRVSPSMLLVLCFEGGSYKAGVARSNAHPTQVQLT